MLAPTMKTAGAAATKTAEVSGKAADAVEASVGWFLTWPSEWPGVHILLRSCENMSGGTATVLLIAGAGFLAYGYRAEKLIMSLNCAILGAWAGGMLGKSGGAIVPGLLIGGFLGGLAAWPLLKFSIQLIATAVGFVVGCCIWRTFPQLDAKYAWAGGTIGSTFLFMLTHSSLRWATLIAIGFQGASLLIMGTLGWLLQIKSIRPNVDSIVGNSYTLPVSILLSTVIGLIYQHKSAAAEPEATTAPPPRR